MVETSALLSHLEAIDAIEMDPDGDLEQLVEHLTKRQELLDRVQSTDIRSLPGGLRNDVEARLRSLQQRTDKALATLKERCDALLADQQQLLKARQAARGYRPDNPKKSRSVNKRA